MKRTMQRKTPNRFGRTPVRTRQDLAALLRRPGVLMMHSDADLMETRASLQRRFRRKAS
jgi:hypothetical protein